MSSLSGMQLDRLQEALRIPPVLGGRYQILRALGRGGMGVVYLAEDSSLQRKVAVKVIDPGVASAELEARLEHEARLLGRLGHPGIVPIYDLGRHDDLTLFYVMKHVDGETLEQWLPAHASRAERLRLFQKLCDPVAFAHSQGIAHRDLKPANVMIGAFGELLIMDWGLARPLGEQVENEHVGTPGYRDPVAFSAKDLTNAWASNSDAAATGCAAAIASSTSTHAASRPGAASEGDPIPASSDHPSVPSCRAEALACADVFSLGAILFFLLTDQHPPETAESLQPRRLDASVDPRLNAICARATHPQRGERYPSVRELEQDVLRYLDGEAVRAYHERWHERAARWIRRHQLVLSLILMYLLMRIIVALVR